MRNLIFFLIFPALFKANLKKKSKTITINKTYGQAFFFISEVLTPPVMVKYTTKSIFYWIFFIYFLPASFRGFSPHTLALSSPLVDGL